MWTSHCVAALCSVLPLASAFPGQANVARQAVDSTGTLSFDPDAQPLTFIYATYDPFSTNWIGLYHASGGGPVNEEYVAPSVVWSYAPEASGSVQLSSDSLEAGDYRAFFLARDGYEWLAEPVTVTVQAPPANIYFPVESATLHNARRLEMYKAKISGLVLGRSDDTVTFSRVKGDGWIDASSDGVIAGTPDVSSQQRSGITVEATASNGSNKVIRMTVPVRSKSDRLVSDLGVMTYNLWHEGTQVNDYHEKQLRFILNSGANVITLQESSSDDATRLGQALGWDYYQSRGSVGVISRYPIVEQYDQISASGGVRIDLTGGSSTDPFEVNVWSAHLGHTPYGPYDFCFDNMTKEEVLAREEGSGRTPQITEILDGIEGQLQNSKSVPLLLAGDFNAPSHLDWVPSLREKNCGVDDFDWPSSILPTQRGLINSFRVAHPDPAAEQATTWSPVFPKHNGATGRDEPQDRIGFVYHTKERLRVVGSERLIVGKPAPSPRHKDNEWTSDHVAVLAHYQLL